MARDRLERTLKRLDRRDALENKLGISSEMTKMRDERACRAAEREERRRGREENRRK